MKCPTCGKEYTDKDVARDEEGEIMGDMINLFTGKPLIPVGAKEETKKKIRRLDSWYFEAMGKTCEIEQMDEIDRAYDEVRESLVKCT